MAMTRNEFEQIQASIAALKNDIDSTLQQKVQLQSEYNALRDKHVSMAAEYRLEIAKTHRLQAALNRARTPIEGVWLWRGDNDHVESMLSDCPVVMSAATLMKILTTK